MVVWDSAVQAMKAAYSGLPKREGWEQKHDAGVKSCLPPASDMLSVRRPAKKDVEVSAGRPFGDGYSTRPTHSTMAGSRMSLHALPRNKHGMVLGKLGVGCSSSWTGAG